MSAIETRDWSEFAGKSILLDHTNFCFEIRKGVGMFFFVKYGGVISTATDERSFEKMVFSFIRTIFQLENMHLPYGRIQTE